MKIIDKENKISLKELEKLAKETFGQLVKAVVDTEKEIVVVGGELHADEEKLLLEQGSTQENLWGINLYPEITGEEWIEFDSMINLKPHQDNLTRGVQSKKIRGVIVKIVNHLVER
jgi:hypothetical protein